MSYRDHGDERRYVAGAIAGGAALASALILAGCKDITVEPITPILQQSVDAVPGEIGDPCVPPDEGDPRFSGFAVSENVIYDHHDQCISGICLVNHFQGRVSCPLGQAAPAPCAGPGDSSCGAAGSCVAAGAAGPYCDPQAPDGGASQCASGVCNAQRGSCECTADAQCPAGTACDPGSRQCRQYVCHEEGSCQTAGASDAENEGKSCCALGSDVPVSAPVCGQCAGDSGRRAEEAVFCSCRCGPAEGAPDDGAEYCACPSGFECTEIRPYVGIGDVGSAGKYCIKQGTEFAGADQCGEVSGHSGGSCHGTSE
ncbi:hypothetical protein [Sorangium sp. So ce426]|uniref:hypothetical protein n=1 Tax=Sorangium sp. So ce426 TaxID=3133312 RepID=UPI003F5B2356